MIRYNKTIELNCSRNDEYNLRTDMGQTWKTTPVKEHNCFTEWLQAHHTMLREHQRDMLQLIHQAYNSVTDLNSMELYWVYQQGKGYSNQSTDIAFATIPSENVYVLMTPANTWIQSSKYQNLVFTVADASGPVTERETRDEIWNFRDYMLHGKIFPTKKIFTDEDYVQKGIAPI